MTGQYGPGSSQYGSFTINNGTFYLNSTDSWDMGAFWYISGGPVINGGVFKTDAEYIRFAASWNAGSKVTFNGGYFEKPFQASTAADNATPTPACPSGYAFSPDTLAALTGDTGEYKDFYWITKSKEKQADVNNTDDGQNNSDTYTVTGYTTYADGSMQATSGTTYTFYSDAAPYRAGYTFAGWATDSVSDSGAQQIEGLTDVTGSVYAVWTEGESAYDVLFDANGGAGAAPGNESNKSTADSIIAPSGDGVSRANYIFSGWAVDPEAVTADYQANDSISVASIAKYARLKNGAQTITLYAVWTPKTVIPDKMFKAQTTNYTGNPIEYALDTVTVGDVEVDGFQLAYYGDYDLTQPLDSAPTEVGTYYVLITRPEDNTYASFSQRVSLRIRGSYMDVSSRGYDGVYDGQPHTISVEVLEPAEGYTIKYGTNRNECVLEEPPTFTSPCSYKYVYYQITAPGYETETGSEHVTIDKKPAPAPIVMNLTYSTQTTGLQTVYLEYPIDAEPTNTQINKTKTENNDGVLDMEQSPTFPSIDGTVQFYLTGTASAGDTAVLQGYVNSKNYEGTTYIITITLNDKLDQAAPGAFGLIFTQDENDVLTAEIPAVEGAEYSFDGSNWSDENTKAGIQPGELVTGYMRMKETDTANASLPTLAAQTPLFAELPSVTYGDESFQLEVTGGSGAGTLSYKVISGDSISIDATGIVTILKAGESTIQVTKAADAPYSAVSANIIISVAKATPVVTFPDASEITYGDTLADSELTGGSGNGTFAWADETAVPVVTNSGYSVVFTPIDADNYDYTSIEGYDSTTQTVTQMVEITVSPRPVNITWVGTEGLVYDGTEKTISAQVANLVGDDVVTLTKDGTLSATEKGEYTASVTAVDNENYTVTGGENLTKQWAIAEGTNEFTTPLSITGWTYGDTPNVPAAAAKFGTPVFTYADAEDGVYSETVPAEAGDYWVKATVPGTASYAEISTTAQFTISKATPASVETPVLEAVTYDPAVTLADITLTEGWAWADSTVVPTVDNEGYAAFYMVDDENYDWTGADGYNAESHRLERTVALTVNPADPVYTAPAELTATYGQTLADVVLPAGFSWQEAADTSVGNAGNNVFHVVFTPEDTANYNTIRDIAVTITVDPAAPVLAEGAEVTAERVRRGNSLSTSEITGTVNGLDGQPLEGTWTWKTDREMDETGTFEETAVFTPTDTNYAPFETSVLVTVYYSSSGGEGSVTRYTVTFDTQGGSEINSIRVTRNGTVTKPEEPTKEGYIFEGWFTDEDCTNAYDFDKRVTENITLYAKWMKEQPDNPTDPNEPEPPVEWENPYNDVDTGDWYYEAVKFANENGLFAGTTETTFAPDESLTRAMLVTILWRAEGQPIVDYLMSFADVDAGAYYGEAVRWAASEGIVKGYSDTEFAPDDLITREQIAVIMQRYAQYKGIVADESDDLSQFADAGDVSDWALGSMQWAVGTGLISGKDIGSLAPQDNTTRAEAAAILMRFLEK